MVTGELEVDIVKIGLCGFSGKMGQAIINYLRDGAGDCKINAEFCSKNTLAELLQFCQDSQVIIDFSTPDILPELLKQAQVCGNKLVIGTTGLTNDHFRQIEQAADKIAILYSPNMSIGANLVIALAAKVAAALDDSYDIEIIETHHRFKKDAPSGTALALGKALCQVRCLEFDEEALSISNRRAARPSNKIHITSIRGGSIAGEHQVLFMGDDEVIAIKHQALNRRMFAAGAIKAAGWIAGKDKGLYSMKDVLGLD